jgi:peptidoglycan hydrolase-like protein with peptidoglycan-binding domain
VRRPSPRRAAVLAGSGLVVLVIGVVTVAVLGSGGGAAGHSSERVGTAVVERRDLVERESADGTLGYGDAHDISAAGSGGSSGSGSGAVTWLPTPGAVVQHGETLFRVNERPVVLFVGSVPIYRSLSSGVDDGEDVRVLEENLAALGFSSGLRIDEHFDGATAAAVRRWQAALGVKQTGTVSPSDVVVQSGPVRVAELKTSVDAAASGPVMSVTGTGRLVTVRLDAAKQSLAKAGDKAQVELPDGNVVDATVYGVGSVATKQSGEDSPRVNVTLVLDDPSKAGTLDEAPVTVDFTKSTAKNVLTVPVQALLAHRGGYAVEVIAGSRRHTVPVQVGTFADSYVAVQGDLHPGDQVAVAQ